MGMSIPHLLVVLAIVALVFGTKHLKNLGGDLGEAIKGFRAAVQTDTEPNDAEAANHSKVVTAKNAEKSNQQG